MGACSPWNAHASRSVAAPPAPVCRGLCTWRYLPTAMSEMGIHRVVVVGGGFGGLQAVLHLRRAPVEVTLVDRRNFHLFQPLTYQVATGGLSAGQIAYPLRAIFKRDRNIRVLMAEASGFDLDGRELQLRPFDGVPAPDSIRYDSLIVAAGSHYSYFGHDEWIDFAHEVKSLESALAVRSQIVSAFEAADAEADSEAHGSRSSSSGAGRPVSRWPGRLASLPVTPAATSV